MTLVVHRTVAEFRRACDAVRATGASLGLVPTMGALHAGHLALIDAARERGTTVAVTIFVNPTQFGPNEDYSRYPRALERDVELCRERRVAHVFAPLEREMYPEGERTRVRVSDLTEGLCGPKRPGHFEGVATIVTKLFAVAGPCTAFFGRKDYQQLKVVERLARDLLLPVEVVGRPTVRDADGLALSSRNAYLSVAERERASALPRALSVAVRAFERGERRAGALRQPVEQALTEAGLRVDYVELAGADALEKIADDEAVQDRAVLAVAAFAENTRLIDNVVLGEDPPPLPEIAP
ncbi:MAG TPA: pantoate--beta-alanine ligase [Polyangiaceae bacterium]|nr:pantoate--beta-alanine ligase [Polyangiaceae bacterium]